MPKTLDSLSDWLSVGYMFLFVLILTYATSAVLGRPLKWIFPSLTVIFALTLLSQFIASIPIVKEYGFESVFFAVILGLLLSNCFKLPEWLKSAVQSEFYIKIGIICLGSTILFGEVMKSGAYGLAQSLIVVFTVWYMAYWIGKKMKIDPEMGTMLASAVSICGVSAAIATCGVIKGDNKKLSYVVSLVLIIAIPMGPASGSDRRMARRHYRYDRCGGGFRYSRRGDRREDGDNSQVFAECTARNRSIHHFHHVVLSGKGQHGETDGRSHLGQVSEIRGGIHPCVSRVQPARTGDGEDSRYGD